MPVVSTAGEHFSRVADGYAATMAPSLQRMAEEVVRRATLQPGERVLDLGTGTGIAAAVAGGEGREIVGVDAAPGMLAIARREVPDVTFDEMDFSALRVEDASFDVAIAVHSLLFATDQVATLREWRRVTRPSGRLSLSVPGPVGVTPTAIYRAIYDRYGIDTTGRYPTLESLADTARAAGWAEIATASDPDTAIVLADDDAFRTWREIGLRSSATAALTDELQRTLTEEMLAATPRTADGQLRIPFGAMYLTARRAAA